MTKKDFELIAEAIRQGRNEPTSTTNSTYNRGWSDGAGAVASYMADALATTNPSFDRARFLAAVVRS